jgi:translocation and assembly module TamB
VAARYKHFFTDKLEDADLMEPKLSLNPQAWLTLLRKFGIRGAIVLLPVVAIALAYGYWWAQENLIPTLDRELSKTLKRPIKLGQVNSLSFNQLRLSGARIPAQANDPDRVEVKEVVVNFDPVKLAIARQLKLDITLVEPNLYIDRDEKGNWVNIPPQETQPEGLIKTKIGNIKIEGGKATIVPDRRQPQVVTTVTDINTLIEVDSLQERVNLDGSALMGKEGRLQVQGEGTISRGAMKLAMQGKKLSAPDLSSLVQIPAVKIPQGVVDGSLEVEIQPEQNLRLLGNLFVSNAQIVIDHVPRTFDRTNGWVQVSDRDVKLTNVSTNYGTIGGLVNGVIDFNRGYQLGAKTNRTLLPSLLKTLNITAPVPIAGEAQGEVKLTGKLDRPILKGKYTSTQVTQIDRVQFNEVQGDFTLADGRIQVQTTAVPRLGGTIQSRGEIKLLKVPQLNFQVAGKDLPGDTFTRLYGGKLPEEIAIGNTSLTGTIAGMGDNFQTNIRLLAPQATYPALVNLKIAPTGKIHVHNGEVKVAGDRVKVEGEIDRNNWQFNLGATAIDAQKLADITKAKLPPQYRGKLTGNLQVKGSMDDPNLDRLQVRGNTDLHLAAGKVIAQNIQVDGGKWQANVSSKSLNLRGLNHELPAGIVTGTFLVGGNSLQELQPDRIWARGSGEAHLNGSKIKTTNLTIDKGVWQGLFTTSNLSLSQFNPQVRGQLTGNFNLAGTIDNFNLDRLRGNGNGIINLPQGKVIARNFQLDRGQWQGNVNLNSLLLGGLSTQIPAPFTQAQLDGNFNISGNLKQLEPKYLNIQGDGKLKLAKGTVTAQQLQVRSGAWTGQFNLDRFNVGGFAPNLPQGFQSAQLSGDFQASGELDKYTPAEIQLVGNGRLNVSHGTITANGLELDRGNWRGRIGFQNFDLGMVNRQISSQLKTAKLTGNFNLEGNIQQLNTTTMQGNGAGEIIFPGGFIQAKNLEIEQGKIRTNLGIKGVKLGLLNQQLPPAIQAGKLNGNYHIAATLQELYPEQIDITGTGNITNILGGNVSLDNIALNHGQWQGKLTAAGLNIATLSKFAPPNMTTGNITGNLSGSWAMAGNINEPNPAKIRAIGVTKLTNFRVGAVKFAPTLIGNIQANPGQGIDINLNGNGDRLALALDRFLHPQNFAFKQGKISAHGTVNNKILSVDLDSLPIALVKPWIPKNAGISQYRLDGNTTGNLEIDLTTNRVTGNNITVSNPIFGGFKGDRLTTSFRANPQQVQLTATELLVGNNRYLFEGKFDPKAKTPTFQAKLTVPQGKLADLRELMQIYNFQDLLQPLNQRKYGTAADLRLPADRGRTYTLKEELNRLSELRRWLDREAEREEADPIPDLRRLQGDFAGEIALANNHKTGLTANFNLIGQNWSLDRYRLDLVEARGKWERGKLALDPLAVTSAHSQIILRGDFGLDRQTGEITARNLPTEWLTSLTPLPVDITGGINLDARIGGNYQNPQLNGDLALVNGQLNRVPLKSAAANFNYRDGRLDFASNANFDAKLDPLAADPINITGSIPYQFPFAPNPPRNLALAIDLHLQNRGLQMIDVLSKKQLRWMDGDGNIDLQIKGKMTPIGEIETLTAKGTGTIARAKIQSQTLPEPITDVHGKVVFDFDRLEVQQLEGQFGRGKVQMAGILPLSETGAGDPARQLQVVMKGLTVKVPEKYQGNVDGQLTIEGTALNPILAGAVKLSQGKVLLPDSPAITASTTPIAIEPPKLRETTTSNSIQLKQLQVTLGDNLQIARPPLLNFTATGVIDVDGTIDNPRPFGQVKIQRGVVNLFTTQFRLASGYPQTADFFPTLGSDPVLNLRLFAKTLESTSSPLTQRNSIAKTAIGSEINETANFYSGLGSVQTVQVEARIAGLASQITQRLELTSTPPRTQPEIVLLLGGGLVERLASGGDNNLGLGIANFASSTLLNNLQDRISDAFSLSDFRLFPTITTNNTTNNTSTLGIAAELGMEVTPKLSTSVLKILTNAELPQYGLRYRLNDVMLLRGSTNLFGDNRAIIEFEQRF